MNGFDYKISSEPEYPKTVHFSMSSKACGEMLMLLNRALNCLDPKDWPAWVPHLITHLEHNKQ